MYTNALTLQEAKSHCRVTHNLDDTQITSLIDVAQEYIETITSNTFDKIYCENGEVLPHGLRHAQLMVIRHLYDNAGLVVAFKPHENQAFINLLAKYICRSL